jgi:hypothetical protein
MSYNLHSFGPKFEPPRRPLSPELELRFKFTDFPNPEPELRIQFGSVQVRIESSNRTFPTLVGSSRCRQGNGYRDCWSSNESDGLTKFGTVSGSQVESRALDEIERASKYFGQYKWPGMILMISVT